MERRKAIRHLLTAGAVPFASRLWASKSAQDFTIRSDVRLVLLDVGVKDPSGAFVPGLSKEYFSVSENGVHQKITVFSHDDLPVTVGIVVDESQSMGRKRQEVLTAAGKLVAESNPQDEIFVLNFNETVRRGLPEGQLFSSDIQQLNTALYRGSPTGRTALYDAVLEGLSQLALGNRDKKALILISDGGDNSSKHNRKDVYEKLDRSLATVYAIGIYDPEDPEIDPALLTHLARVSGGEAYFPTTPAAMTDICRGIAKDIRTRYTVGYVPPEHNGGSLRRIHVTVKSPTHAKLVALARKQYRYEENPHPGSK